ncbi:hypothetical protein [Tenacibaculum maritimum]|uniref:hypothetical protein n=1 Tax=Tenacibaculum maritimum TaxID=107401 RepID=UPI001330DC25|nr:hypothetical protein [Tenacibaculum maritimum]
MADRYPTFSELESKESLCFDTDSIDFLERYFSSLPLEYLRSTDGLLFIRSYRHFLVLYNDYLLSLSDGVCIIVKPLDYILYKYGT